jgi:hypothetical protein
MNDKTNIATVCAIFGIALIVGVIDALSPESSKPSGHGDNAGAPTATRGAVAVVPPPAPSVKGIPTTQGYPVPIAPMLPPSSPKVPIVSRAAVFEKIVAQFEDIPDKGYASYKEADQWADQTDALIRAFDEIPFDASKQTDDAREILELWHNRLEGKYSGALYNEVKTDMVVIDHEQRTN